MIAILGGGITGLTAGYYLQKANRPYVILEKNEFPGGNIRTLINKYYHLETGPNTLQLNDKIFEFLEEVGLADHMVRAGAEAKYRYILKKGAYQQLPSSPFSLLASSFFSVKAKWAILKERSMPAMDIAGETVDQFCRRRFGDEITDYVVHPFISGIYAGDPETLLVAEAFPRLKEWEKSHGSVAKGFSEVAKSNEHKGIISFPGGMGFLTQHLAEGLNIEYNTEVESVSKHKRGFSIKTNGEKIIADQVISTLPAYVAGDIFESLAPAFSESLKEINYPPVSVVYTAYKKTQVRKKLPGFGALHPPLENAFSLGTLFTSTLFPTQCPEDEVLFTTFVGGSQHPQKASLSDQMLMEKTKNELGVLLSTGGLPVFQAIQRWPNAIPQYDAAILGYKPFLEKLSSQGLFFGGNWVGGVSVANCIEKGKALAESVITS